MCVCVRPNQVEYTLAPEQFSRRKPQSALAHSFNLLQRKISIIIDISRGTKFNFARLTFYNNFCNTHTHTLTLTRSLRSQLLDEILFFFVNFLLLSTVSQTDGDSFPIYGNFSSTFVEAESKMAAPRFISLFVNENLCAVVAAQNNFA